MKKTETSQKVFKEYMAYLGDEEMSIVSESVAVYATAFNDMVTVSDYDKDAAAGLLDVSYKTVTRYQKEKKKFSPLQSEYILKTIALFNKGNEVFGSTESFNRWLDKPAFGLGNRIPRTLIITVTGINHIIDELNRIAHGDLS